MMSRMHALLQRPGVRYLLIGGSVYVFELVVIVVALQAGLGSVAAVALSYILGTLVSFVLQKLVTFRDKRLHHRIVVPQLLATVALLAWNFTFSLGVTAVLDGFLPVVACRTIALAITTIWNFYLYKTRIFKHPEELYS